ncbi:PLC-like phosphodiesterase [Chiua virens]|nr:PLC-like phosphodiesterase [Chiua virens]
MVPVDTEMWASNNPIPILRRAPVLTDTHEDHIHAIREMVAFIEDLSPPAPLAWDSDANAATVTDTRDGNLRRSISARISRAAKATNARAVSHGVTALPAERESRRARRRIRVSQVMSGLGRCTTARVRTNPQVQINLSLMRVFHSTAHLSLLSPTTIHPRMNISPTMQTESIDGQNAKSSVEVPVPPLLQQGVPMTKISAKSQKGYIFRLDADQGQIIWESKKLRIIPIENIKELRSGSDARYYRQQFQLAREYEDRWITIIYILDGQYKTLHLIASSSDVFHLWDITLRKLYAIRQELMTGLGNEEIRQAVWMKQCWKWTGEQNDQRLSFEQVEKLCRRLNINSSQEDFMRLFKSADSQNRQSLDFADFQTFVKLLKARPEIDILYRKLCLMGNGRFTFSVFECFMRDTQKSSLTPQELENLFTRYSTKVSDADDPKSPPSLANLVMSLDTLTAFLLSSDNAAFVGQNGKLNQPMTHPLCDYFISSSHNTYLIGHQLVGVSTIEGYIRALLHSCRSVELDIFDGELEPMVFHGKTLTSKVSVREVCEAITKYAFVTSPYPIIISAEIHCSLSQQELLANIMCEVFGEALVSAPIEGKPVSGPLPSPEDLKGRVLLKAKNLYVSESEPMRERDLTLDTESSSTSETSASDSDVVHEIKEEFKKVKLREVEAVKEIKEEFRKARNVFRRVRGRGSSPEKSVTTALASTAMTTSTAIIEQSPKLETKSSPKARMSPALVALLVYTVGVKCRGINKKEHYATEHMFSLSETTMNKILKQGACDLIKHNKTHLARIYPKGMRVSSTNYLPHRYWAAGAQLVAINWQTFDLGYMINHAMFQRNGRTGYVLKPEVLRKTEDPRKSDKEHLHHHTRHYLEVIVISAQQLPRPKDAMGHEITDRHVDPYVEVSVHTPDWNHPSSSSSFLSPPVPGPHSRSATSTSSATSSASATKDSHVHAHRSVTTMRTSAVKNNGFNPVWQETLRLPFECVGDMSDLVFVRFTIQRDGESDGEPIAVYCVSLGSLAMGYRHLPLHDSQVSQYLFSTLFVRCSVYDADP